MSASSCLVKAKRSRKKRRAHENKSAERTFCGAEKTKCRKENHGKSARGVASPEVREQGPSQDHRGQSSMEPKMLPGIAVLFSGVEAPTSEESLLMRALQGSSQGVVLQPCIDDHVTI